MRRACPSLHISQSDHLPALIILIHESFDTRVEVRYSLITPVIGNVLCLPLMFSFGFIKNIYLRFVSTYLLFDQVFTDVCRQEVYMHLRWIETVNKVRVDKRGARVNI